VVNDRFDLALACEADAVHLGQEDLPPDAVPPAARKRLAIGRSTHDVAEATASCGEAVDYVAFGPVFGTTSKRSEYAARGVPMLREIARIVAPRALIAIGGIEAAMIPELIRTGIAGVAVISAVAAAADPEAATRELTRLLEQTGARGEVGP
jgi:thiamine-phosphate pyrophosphorylase